MAESTDAHNKLQSNLSKTMQEIYDQEKHIAQLKKSIRDKEAPLKVLYRIPIAPVYLNLWILWGTDDHEIDFYESWIGLTNAIGSKNT